jgi:hypothetical protein
MVKAKGYSLWLMPIGDIYRRLSETISQLSSEYGTPNFQPHITLLGELSEDEEYIIKN